ncbi:MAG: LapA family protein [Rhodospirillales bacterium]
MLKLAFYLITGAAIIIFASQNLEIVRVYLIAGSPVEVPLIVVVGISFLAGFVFAILSVIRKVVRGGGKRTGTSTMDSRRGM